VPGELPRKDSPNPPPKKRILERTRDAIEEAAAAGFFENVPGSGQPLDFSFEENPFIPNDLRPAWRMLKNAGYALPWMEDRKDIEKRHAELTRRLESYLKRVASSHERIARMPEYLQPSRRARLRDEHAAFVASFRAAADSLNVRIEIYNLSVPSLTLQVSPFKTDDAIRQLSESDPRT
jgi:hypothetical protein